MVRDISDSEIKNAMFGIEDSKAPGLDGYTACFYKSAWSIVEKEISQAVKEFFSNGKLLGEVNATIISLVPKIPTPDKVSDFRPIACCNVLYKCISKILTSRIKDVLGKLVGENQSAFIEGRQITDNILLSQELFKGYNRKQKIKIVAFKIDLQKAYDTISWDFLREILVMFGFPKAMVNWIMTCITSAKFYANVNGERVGCFKGERGLRQGDPKSSLLRKHCGVKWIYMERLKDKNIWEAECDSNCTMGWKNILTSPLSDFIDTRDIYDARLNKKCSIKEIVIDGRWKWPEEWNNDFAELNMIQVPMINEDIEDNANDWYPLVWFTQNIPRHAFVTWLAIQERIMTQDRIKIWKPNEDLKCSLYNSCIDSHDHLFFTCEFSKEVWNELHNMLNVRLSVRWNPIIREMVALPINRNIWSIVRRIVLNAAVYCIWQERNHRIFKNEKRDKEAIINLMKENTMMKLMGLKVKDSSTVKVVEHRWQMYAFDIDVSVSCNWLNFKRSRDAIIVHEMFNGGVEMLSLYMRCSTNESRWSQDVIVVHAMLNKLVEMVSLYMRCSTEESRCYRYSLDVQRRSRDAIVVHKMFNGGVEMLSLCSTDESRCYRCTRDVQWMSQEAIVVHEIFNGGVEMLSRSRDSIVVHEMFNRGVEILSLYMRCSTKESRCYRCTRDV
ncbi:RNA-directed DNA polymerase, eukaryota, reverse transcriptase zinc-binding domain protein [Tanacetum coccineum]